MKILVLFIFMSFLIGNIFYFATGHKCQTAVAAIYKIKIDIHKISQAVELYKSEIGALPRSLDDLVGVYLKVRHTDPWGMDFHYETQKDNEFKVFTLGSGIEVGGIGLATDMSRETDFDSLLEYISAPIYGCNV